MALTTPKAEHQNQTKDERSSLLGAILKDPLLHFTLLAILIFIINQLAGRDEKEVIIIDAATQEYLFEQERSLLLRDLRQADKERIVDSFIEDELLVREAKKRGFTDNSRVRALLIQNMRFFLRDNVKEPSEQELRAYFNANIQEFESPASFSYDQVFYQGSEDIPPGLIEKLQRGADHTKLGDQPPLGSLATIKATERDIIGTFGPDEAKKILSISDEGWHGPFVSYNGSHFLRIGTRYEPVQPRFDDVRKWVSMQWSMTQHRKKLDDDLNGFKKNYIIQIEPLQSESDDL